MLSPYDYAPDAINNKVARDLMSRITFEHGGPDYDAKYPDGIPTSLVITLNSGATLDSGLVMYPAGHARNTDADLTGILNHKFGLMGSIAFTNDATTKDALGKLNQLDKLSSGDLQKVYEFELASRPGYE
jgi:2-methylcitrate dehydratase